MQHWVIWWSAQASLTWHSSSPWQGSRCIFKGNQLHHPSHGPWVCIVLNEGGHCLKDEFEPYHKMIMETIMKVVATLGALDIDERLWMASYTPFKSKLLRIKWCWMALVLLLQLFAVPKAWCKMGNGLFTLGFPVQTNTDGSFLVVLR